MLIMLHQLFYYFYFLIVSNKLLKVQYNQQFVYAQQCCYWTIFGLLSAPAVYANKTNYIHLIKSIGGVTSDVNNERARPNNSNSVPLTVHPPNSLMSMMFVEAMHLQARRTHSMFSFYWQCNLQTILKFAPYQYITGIWQVYDIPFALWCVR